MSEKMCSVNDLLVAGYTSSEVISNSYCPPVRTFLSKFVKTGYTSTVSGRSDEQLFPLSDINENHIVLEPTLTFDHPSLSMDSTEKSKNNGFTYSNLEGPWTVTISNQSSPNNFSVSVDSANNRVLVTSLIWGSSIIDNTCTVTLTGTRVDGQGTYSASFEVIQYAKVAMYYLRFWNQISDYDGSVVFDISNGKDNQIQVIYNNSAEIPIYSGDTLEILASRDVIFIIKGSDNILLSGAGVCLNRASLPYCEISDNYPGKEGITIDVYLIPGKERATIDVYLIPE